MQYYAIHIMLTFFYVDAKLCLFISLWKHDLKYGFFIRRMKIRINMTIRSSGIVNSNQRIVNCISNGRALVSWLLRSCNRSSQLVVENSKFDNERKRKNIPLKDKVHSP